MKPAERATTTLAATLLALVAVGCTACSDTVDSIPWEFSELPSAADSPVGTPAAPRAPEQPTPEEPGEVPRCAPDDSVSPVRIVDLQRGGDNSQGYIITSAGVLFAGRLREGQQDLWHIRLDSVEPERLTHSIDREVLGDGRGDEFIYGEGSDLFIADLAGASEGLGVEARRTPLEFESPENATGARLLGDELIAWFEQTQVGVIDRRTGARSISSFRRLGNRPQVQAGRVAFVAAADDGSRGIALWSRTGETFLPVAGLASFALADDAVWWIERASGEDNAGAVYRMRFGDEVASEINDGPCTNLIASADGSQVGFSCGFRPADHPRNTTNQSAPTEIFLHDGQELQRVLQDVTHVDLAPPWNGWIAYSRFLPRTDEPLTPWLGKLIVQSPVGEEIVVDDIESIVDRSLEFENGILLYDSPYDGRSSNGSGFGLVYVCAAIDL